jgi:hypothetical protein
MVTQVELDRLIALDGDYCVRSMNFRLMGTVMPPVPHCAAGGSYQSASPRNLLRSRRARVG